MQEYEVKTIKGNAKVETAEKKTVFAEVFPRKSIFLINTDGRDTKSDKTVAEHRRDWAAHEGRPKDFYKKRAAEYQAVRVKLDDDIGGLRDRIARAMGIPETSVELRAPDGNRANPNWTLDTFLNKWKKG